MLVVDASVLAPIVADGGDDGRRLRHRIRREAMAGPDLLRVEVTSVLRRHLRGGALTVAEAQGALDAMVALPLLVFPTTPLLRRVWALRDNLSSYDACYVALAEALGVPLLTADRRLAGEPGVRCVVEVA